MAQWRAPYAIGLISLGIALRLYEFGRNYSLSIDEAAIARNLIDRGWPTILRPLDYAQIAPPAFLVVQKAIVSLAGSGEFALRLFPLVCGIASVPLIWIIARRLMPPTPATCALLLFALNRSLIEYSAQAKQYSIDVAVALTVVLIGLLVISLRGRGKRSPEGFALQTHRWSAKALAERPIALGVIGAATAAFSFAGTFVLLGAAAAALLFAVQQQGRSALRRGFIAPTVWIAGAICGVVFGRLRLTPSDAEYMSWFWASGFMPLDTSAARWLWIELEKIFAWTAHYRASGFWVALAALGAFSLYRRGRSAAAMLLLAPLTLVIAASAARLYPLAAGRVELFLLPLLLILVAEGAWWCHARPAGRFRWLGAAPMVLVLALALHSTLTVKEQRDTAPVRPFLNHVKAHWLPDDLMFVYHGFGQAFLYYAPRLEFTPDQYVIGSCSRGAGRTYLRELDRLRGRSRVWIVMARDDEIELDLYRRYLDSIGTRLTSGEPDLPFGYLYDLTRPPQGVVVSAETFPLRPALSRDEPYQWNCYGVFRPLKMSVRSD